MAFEKKNGLFCAHVHNLKGIFGWAFLYSCTCFMQGVTLSV